MNAQNKPLVSICSITYNHAPYIRQCLDGMLMQKTDFKYEIIINDDCSTDGTTEIVKEYASKYPDILKPIFHDENQYSKGVRGIFATFVFPKAQGKYIAICEGDDYWTDPMKLQKQVDFMESHHECGLCFTNFVRSDKKKHHQHFVDDTKYERALIEDKLTIGTLTTLFRKTNYDKLKKNWIGKGWRMGDLPLWIELSHEANVHFINEITAVYRVLEESASHSRDIGALSSFNINAYEIRNFYNLLYGKKYKVEYPYKALMKCAYGLNDCKTANRMIIKCIKAGHHDIRTFLFYLGTIIPGLKYILNLYYK